MSKRKNKLLGEIASSSWKVVKTIKAENHKCYTQDLKEKNKKDAIQCIEDNELCRLVSQDLGKVIGYIHKDYIDKNSSALKVTVFKTIKHF